MSPFKISLCVALADYIVLFAIGIQTDMPLKSVGFGSLVMTAGLWIACWITLVILVAIREGRAK